MHASVSHHRRVGRFTAVLTVGVWILILLATAPWSTKLNTVERNGATDQLPASAESTRVAETAATLPGGDSYAFIVLYHRPDGLTQDDLAAAREHRTTMSVRYARVAGTGSAGSGIGEGLIPSGDGSAALFFLAVDSDRGEANDIAAELRATVAERPPGLEVTLTGQGGVDADITGVFRNIDRRLLLATVAVVAILLVLTYRSPVLWIVPLLAVGCASLLSMAAVYLMVKITGITVTTESASILQVLVFGTGTDYALLIVARYREELRRNKGAATAMSAALRGVGPAIAASAATVIAGLLCLLAADVNGVRGLGPVAAVGIACTLVVMTSLFPAALVLLGRPVFWPKVPRFDSAGQRESRLWNRLGRALARRPWTASLILLVVLGGLAVGLRVPAEDLGEADVFTKQPESVAGFELLAQRFPELGGKPLTVLTRPPQRDQVLTIVRQTPGILRAAPGRIGATWVEITATPVDAPDSPAERDTIVRLRDRVHGVDGSDAIVGGRSAQLLDQTEASERDRRRVIPLILLVVIGVLMMLLRSVVAAVLLVATVVLSFAAAMGASLLVFTHVFGFPGLGATVPLFGFLFLVALGVDYNIFLMSRAQEEARRFGTRVGMAHALTSTGGVITSAGVVLAATFAVLAMLPLVFMVELGFLVAFGVLLDTLVVRSVLVPALAFGIGRRVWWPGRLARPDPRPRPTPQLERTATPVGWPAGQLAASGGPPVAGEQPRSTGGIQVGQRHPLHDVLGQSISAISVQASVAALLEANSHHGDPRLRELGDRLREIARISRDGTAGPPGAPDTVVARNTRAANGSPPGLDQLDALVGRTRATGTTVWIDVVGEPRRLPPSLDAAAFRILEEALVSVVPHAEVREVRIQIEYDVSALRVVVADDSIGGFRVDALLPLAAVHDAVDDAHRQPSAPPGLVERSR